MSKEEQNKAVVGRWFTEFWGQNPNLAVIDKTCCCTIRCTNRAAAAKISG